MIIHERPSSEISLAFAPLSEVSEKLVDAMRSDGSDRHCGMCHKPFTVARKPRGIARVVHGGSAGVMLSTWLLCGHCKFKATKVGGQVPASMLDQARKSYDAYHTLQTQPCGSA